MKRFRRLRVSPEVRALVRETTLDVKDFIYPLFVTVGENVKEPVASMPGVFRYSVDRLDEILRQISDSGVSGVMIFGIPERKDEYASEAYSKDGPAQRAVRYIKERFPELIAIADVCLCEYTSHGHCGVVCGGRILNDETLPLLAKTAVSLAGAGADMIAPSDMMDGRVSAIRRALDDAGFYDLAIMSYSAKFASAYYAPFREAADSAPSFGDRRTYQMDCANGREALSEIEDDINEGADIVMVKPAIAYLDVIRAARDRFDAPIAAYSVSGEYSMVKAAAEQGIIDEERIVLENLTAIKRAGADIIITYHALEAARWLKDGFGRNGA